MHCAPVLTWAASWADLPGQNEMLDLPSSGPELGGLAEAACVHILASSLSSLVTTLVTLESQGSSCRCASEAQCNTVLCWVWPVAGAVELLRV